MTTLVTWDCDRAFRKKKDRVLTFDPDVLVIQECENPDTNGDWSEFSDWLWVGENENKGLGVFSRNDLSLEPASVEGEGGRFTLPVVIDDELTLLGVWAMNDRRNPANRYIGQVYRALEEYREFIDSNTIVAGDFNWNVVWDESPKSRLRGDFSDTLGVLNDCGLQSVYHSVTNTEFGTEDDPTFFMHKNEERPYHIDYVFAPDRMVESVTEFTVGEYDDWFDVSDHLPIVVELQT